MEAVFTTSRFKLVVMAIMLGFTTGTFMAHDEPSHYDNSKDPHESPHPATPPEGGHQDCNGACSVGTTSQSVKPARAATRRT